MRQEFLQYLGLEGDEILGKSIANPSAGYLNFENIIHMFGGSQTDSGSHIKIPTLKESIREMLSLCQKFKAASIAIPDLKSIYHLSVRDVFLNECKRFIDETEEKFVKNAGNELSFTKILIMCDSEEEVKLYEQSILRFSEAILHQQNNQDHHSSNEDKDFGFKKQYSTVLDTRIKAKRRQSLKEFG